MSAPSFSATLGAQVIRIEPSFGAWRDAARPLLMQRLPPEQIRFLDSTTPFSPPLFSIDAPANPTANHAAPIPYVPKNFLRRAETVACHRDPDRWNLLYRLLWRLQGNRNLLHLELDYEVALFRRLEHQVSRDLHKMHAFVRFRRVVGPEGETYISWYEPDHHILPLAAPFFTERFAVMHWSILSPDASMHWDANARQLRFGPGISREMAPAADELESLWRTYYGSIFNPARTNLRAMRNEMPVRYWKNLPEIENVPELLARAGTRVDTMIQRQSRLDASPWVPDHHSLPVLQKAVPGCQGCSLYECATQAVFGEGPASARLMLVGEQPGNEEDLSGSPFVGPAGRLLDELLSLAEIERKSIYITNAVKHFKFVQRGKHRLHENPRISEINACRPWLLAELDAVRPQLVVCLGASAAKSLLGAKFALTRDRGKVVSSPWAAKVIATFHPSAVLRTQAPERASEMRSLLVADLKRANSILFSSGKTRA